MKKDNKGIIIAVLILGIIIVSILLPLIFMVLMVFVIPMTSKPIEYTSIDKYDYAIGDKS